MNKKDLNLKISSGTIKETVYHDDGNVIEIIFEEELPLYDGSTYEIQG